LRSDSLADWVKEVLLILSVLDPSVESDVSGTMTLNNSLHWKSGSKVEWSVDMESEIFIHSFLGNLLCFIKIHNLPFLVVSVVLVMNDNWSSFFVLCSINIECFTVLQVDELFVFILEDLEPSRVGAPDLHVVGLSGVLNIP
jgi:hypothetical protein